MFSWLASFAQHICEIYLGFDCSIGFHSFTIFHCIRIPKIYLFIVLLMCFEVLPVWGKNNTVKNALLHACLCMRAHISALSGSQRVLVFNSTGSVNLFSKGVALMCLPNSSEWEFLLLYTCLNDWYYRSFKFQPNWWVHN